MTENNTGATPQVDVEPPRPNRAYDHDAAVLLLLAADERFAMITESVNGEDDGDRYTLNREGVWRLYLTAREGEKRQLIAALPLIMSRRFVDDRGGVRFELAWLTDEGEVKRQVVTAETLNDAGKLFRVIPDNAITSTTSKACVEYLSHLRRRNREWLVETTQRVMTALGWDVEGTATFTAGHGRPHLVHDTRNTGKWLKAYRQQGTLQGWVDVVHEVADRVPVQVVLSASLAAPLLRVLGADNFAIDHHGSSSTGKTGTGRGGMSAWAEPVPTTVPWSDTETSMNHKLAMLRGLPILLDDTQLTVKDPKKLEQVVYGLTQGKSKGRSTGDGREMQDVVDYEAVALITGETSVLSLTKMPGISGRVVPLSGAAFADKAQAQAFTKGCRANFGHAGPAFVEHLQGQDAVELRARWDDLRKVLSDQVEGEIPGRRADSVAVLQLANQLGHEIGLLPLLPQDVWVTLTEGGEAGLDGGNDRPLEALGKILDWAVMNRARFYERGQASGEGLSPQGGWLGRWEAEPARNAKFKTPYVGFNREKLADELTRLGYQPDLILNAWAERKWLLTTAKSGIQHKTQVGDSNTNVVAVTEVGDLFARSEEDTVTTPSSNVVSIAEHRWAQAPGLSNADDQADDTGDVV
jgi:hypothetical protein